MRYFFFYIFLPLAEGGGRRDRALTCEDVLHNICSCYTSMLTPPSPIPSTPLGSQNLGAGSAGSGSNFLIGHKNRFENLRFPV